MNRLLSEAAGQCLCIGPPPCAVDSLGQDLNMAVSRQRRFATPVNGARLSPSRVTWKTWSAPTPAQVRLRRRPRQDAPHRRLPG